MSAQENVIKFFQKACDDSELQNQLKPPCPPTREGFADVAQKWGYEIVGSDIDDYVRFADFYSEFQKALDKHQDGTEKLSDWLNKWQKHIKKIDKEKSIFDDTKISKYMYT